MWWHLSCSVIILRKFWKNITIMNAKMSLLILILWHKGLFGYSWKLKTEKHCNKIIFKYVNSTVEPIFNEKVDKKWYLWVREQCTNALFTVEKVSLYGWKQKKEKRKKKDWNTFCAQTWTQNAQTKHSLSV